MYEFSLKCPVVFGVNSMDTMAKRITTLTADRSVKRLLIVTSEVMEWNRSMISDLKENLIEEGFDSVVFDGVEPNPTTDNIEQGKTLYKAEWCDGIIALGGGSPIDASKVIADETNASLLITIPTTSGTGSEISPWSVITATDSNTKMSMCTRIPDLALLDPQLTITMPPALTLFTGIDAFSHAVEAYASTSSNGFTDGLSLESIQLILKSFSIAVKDGGDINARTDMLEASLLAGAAMMHAGLGLAHAMANTIGGFYHGSVHGWLIAQTLEAVCDFNRNAFPDKYRRIEPIVKDVMNQVGQMFEILGLTRDVLEKAHFNSIVEMSMANINSATNPRAFTREDLEKLLNSCFEWK
ncbi:MAG: iron-containing alcohol dehydrogenase [Proteobacteria bacterium]|nr:iron-containing alcohol dehydrogenase [Pseudomonadota bacterium]